MSNTTTHYVYWYFSEYEERGYSYIIGKNPPSERDEGDGWTFVQEIELPEVDRELVVNNGVKKIDDEIIDKKLEIKNLEDKKQQLLALDFQS